MRIAQPVLLLEFLHVAEVQLRHRGRAVLRLGVFALDPRSDRVYRRVHQLLEIERAGAIAALVVTDAQTNVVLLGLVGGALLHAELELIEFLLFGA